MNICKAFIIVICSFFSIAGFDSVIESSTSTDDFFNRDKFQSGYLTAYVGLLWDDLDLARAISLQDEYVLKSFEKWFDNVALFYSVAKQLITSDLIDDDRLQYFHEFTLNFLEGIEELAKNRKNEDYQALKYLLRRLKDLIEEQLKTPAQIETKINTDHIGL